MTLRSWMTRRGTAVALVAVIRARDVRRARVVRRLRHVELVRRRTYSPTAAPELHRSSHHATERFISAA